MDLHERLDRAIGSPTVRVDVESAIADARVRERRTRGLVGATALAVVAAVAGGVWLVRDGDDLRAAEQGAVSLDVCTSQQQRQLGEGLDPDLQAHPVLVTGPSSICLDPDLRVTDRIDGPIAGHRAVVLRLRSERDPSNPSMNLAVVWGGFGLDDAWATPLMDFDWAKALTGTTTDGSRPLEQYAAELGAEGFPEATDRTHGWEHCPGAGLTAEQPVRVIDGTTCVADGFEVVDHAAGDELVDAYLHDLAAVITPEDRASVEAARTDLTDMQGWELVNRQGRFVYAVTGLDTPDGQQSALPMGARMPLSLVLVMGRMSSVEGSDSSSDSASDSASSAVGDGDR